MNAGVIARYYDPATAQFLTRDPAVSTTLSPYGYVAGDPINGSDPAGQSPADPDGPATCGSGVATPFGCWEPGIPGGGLDGGFNSSSAQWSWSDLFNLFALANLEDGEGEVELGCEEIASEAAAGEELGEAGVQAAEHGAERLAQAGFTPETIAATKAGQVFTQADGASVYVNEVSPGRYDFIIEGNDGVVTAHTNWPLNSITRIAKSYGWNWTP